MEIREYIHRLLKESEIPKHLLRRLDLNRINGLFEDALIDASKKYAKNKDNWNFMDEYKFNKMVVSHMIESFFSDEEYYNSVLFTEMWDDLYNFFSEYYYDQIRDRYYAIEGESGVVCEDCGWFWYLSDGGDDPYVCHKCGNDNTPKKTNVYESIRRILREETDNVPYAVIEITKPIARMDLPYYYQEVPLWKTKQDKIYLKRGAAGIVTISTKNIKVLRVFDNRESEEMKDYLKELRGLLINERLTESDPKTGTGKKPEGSSRRLYTDENPSDTVSVKFRTKEDIVDTLNKDSFKSKPHKRQSQIINLIHQRVRAAYQNAKDPETKKRLKRAYDYIESVKEKSKEKTVRLRKQEQNESEITEKCWAGYTQKGMKTMFGKRYPNCVKKTKK